MAVREKRSLPCDLHTITTQETTHTHANLGAKKKKEKPKGERFFKNKKKRKKNNKKEKTEEEEKVNLTVGLF